MGGGGKTERGRLGTGGDDSRDLRRKDKGILFVTRTETGAGGEHDEDSTGRGENTSEGQTGVGGTSAVESRGGDGTRDDLFDEGTMLAVDGVSDGERDKSGVSMRVDTSEAGGKGEREGAAEDCGDDGWRGGEGVNAGVVDREDGEGGDDWGRSVTTWADVGEAGEGERESASFLR
jgi:hypothetical protein